MAKTETSVEQPEANEKNSKKGLKLTLIIVAVIAIIQCVWLGFAFKEPIVAFFEGFKPEPVEAILYYPLESMSVNLADEGGNRFLKTTVSLEYNDPELEATLTAQASHVQGLILNLIRSKTLEEIDSVEETNQLGQELVEALNKEFKTKAFKAAYFTEYLYQ